MKEALQKNIENIVEREMKGNDLDWVWINTGEEGSGKSAFSLALAQEIDPEFSVDQIVFSGEEFMKKAGELDPYKPIILDEGIESLYSRNAMKKANKQLVQFLRQCRELHLFIIINLPDVSELDKSIRFNRAKTVSRCVKQGWAWLYNSQQVKQIQESKSGVDWPEPVLKTSWKNPEKEFSELWNDYKEKKLNNVKNLSEPEMEDSNEWLQAAEAGKLIGVSKSTIHNWRDDGTIGSEAYSKLPNGEFRFKKSEIEKLLEED